MKRIIYILIPAIMLLSCSKEIELDVPDQESQLVVECYLDPGKPYRLTLSETVNFLSDPGIREVTNALVTITYLGVTDTLVYNPTTINRTGKFYNYTSTTTVPDTATINYNEDFTLYVEDAKGRVVTATTRFLPVVPIDTVTAQFEPTNVVSFLLAAFQEVVNETNYYRIVFNKDSLGGEEIQAFSFDDELVKNEPLVIGTPYEFYDGDSAYVTLYHIDQEYNEFLETIQLSLDANGNPFATPSKIFSTVQGGVGAFEALSYDRVGIVATP